MLLVNWGNRKNSDFLFILKHNNKITSLPYYNNYRLVEEITRGTTGGLAVYTNSQKKLVASRYQSE